MVSFAKSLPPNAHRRFCNPGCRYLYTPRSNARKLHAALMIWAKDFAEIDATK